MNLCSSFLSNILDGKGLSSKMITPLRYKIPIQNLTIAYLSFFLFEKETSLFIKNETKAQSTRELYNEQKAKGLTSQIGWHPLSIISYKQ